MKKTERFIKTAEGLRIDFTDIQGKSLNYLRFEHTNCEDNVPTYIGSIDKTQKAKLRKLKAEIDLLLGTHKPAPKAKV